MDKKRDRSNRSRSGDSKRPRSGEHKAHICEWCRQSFSRVDKHRKTCSHKLLRQPAVANPTTPSGAGGGGSGSGFGDGAAAPGTDSSSAVAAPGVDTSSAVAAPGADTGSAATVSAPAPPDAPQADLPLFAGDDGEVPDTAHGGSPSGSPLLDPPDVLDSSDSSDVDDEASGGEGSDSDNNGDSDSDSDSDSAAPGHQAPPGPGALPGAGASAQTTAASATARRQSARTNKGQRTGDRFVEAQGSARHTEKDLPSAPAMPRRRLPRIPIRFGYDSGNDEVPSTSEDDSDGPSGVQSGQSRPRRGLPTLQELGRARYARVLETPLHDAGADGESMRPAVARDPANALSAIELDMARILGVGDEGAGGAGSSDSPATAPAWPEVICQSSRPMWFRPVGEHEAVSNRLKTFWRNKLDASLGFAKAHCHWSTQPLDEGVEPGPFECHEPLCLALRRERRCAETRLQDTLTSLGVFAAILSCKEDVGRRSIETISDVFSGGHNKVNLDRTKVNAALLAVADACQGEPCPLPIPP